MAHSATLTTHRRHQQIRWVSGLDVLAGVWLLCSAFFIPPGGGPEAGGVFWNFLIVGALVSLMALVRAGGAYRQAWLSWGNLLLGAWVVISPWALGYAMHEASVWNAILTGGVIVVLAGWSAMVPSGARTPREAQTGRR